MSRLARKSSSARGVNWLYEKHHSFASHTVLGIVVASTLLIVPTQFSGTGNVLASIGCFAAGFIAALIMDRLHGKLIDE